jgi:hypothetical protein
MNIIEVNQDVNRNNMIHGAQSILAIFVVTIALLIGNPMSAVAENAREGKSAKKKEYLLVPGEKWKNKSATVTGTVVNVSRGRIILEYARIEKTAKEIHLNLGLVDDIQFDHLQGIADVHEGDVVKVAYKDKFVENTEGVQTQYSRWVTNISLVRRGTTSGKFISGEAMF